MAVLGVSITKQWMWEGREEEFSNVYAYSTEDGAPDLDIPSGISDSDATSLVNQIADVERNLHADDVNFVSGRVWGPLDAPQSARQTIAIVDLQGSGTFTRDPASCLEDTTLIRVRTGRLSVRDRPVWLRKWFRTMGPADEGSSAFSDEVHARMEQLEQTHRDAVRTQFLDLLVVNLNELTSFPDRLILCSPSGRRLDDYDNPQMEVYPYLQTHDVKY